MELSEEEKTLIQLLKKSGADKTMIISINLLLHKSEDAMEKLILYIWDNSPTLDQITEKSLELCENLPPEQQPDEA